ncbi:MAG TPA: chemotaxis protein CheW [Blastocatellia bacterium]|nr:chemotaxis protein CheW [Blastocatellia bacterium]
MAKSPSDTLKDSRPDLSAIPLQPGGADKAELVSVLLFEVGGESYAIGVETTEGVVDCPKLTPLPGAPVGVVGLASVRGRMTVVMNLGSTAAHEPVKRRLILVKGDAQLGLLADRVDGVLGLDPKKVRPVAHGRNNLTAQKARFVWPARSYFKSGTDRIPIIDVERLGEA